MSNEDRMCLRTVQPERKVEIKSGLDVQESVCVVHAVQMQYAGDLG